VGGHGASTWIDDVAHAALGPDDLDDAILQSAVG
jgi:hypothetical protein